MNAPSKKEVKVLLEALDLAVGSVKEIVDQTSGLSLADAKTLLRKTAQELNTTLGKTYAKKEELGIEVENDNRIKSTKP